MNLRHKKIVVNKAVHGSLQVTLEDNVLIVTDTETKQDIMGYDLEPYTEGFDADSPRPPYDASVYKRIYEDGTIYHRIILLVAPEVPVVDVEIFLQPVKEKED